MRIHQLLHGYSDGHRLLAGSKELPRAAKHAMLTLSDMSGRSMLAGFEDYLTAYPIPEADAYAFARTWYAPEMERPGCVWTHTLVIDNREIGALADLLALEAAFRRPTRGDSFESYSTPLDVASNTKPMTDLGGMPSTAVLCGLYSSPESPVMVVVPNAIVFRAMASALWNQQWPELRASFSFCTGSISNRLLSGRPLDLQFIPSQAIREVRREVDNAIFVDDATPELPVAGDWVPLALNDLCHPDRGLRNLVASLAQSIAPSMVGRSAFEPLLQYALCVGDSTERSGSLQGLSEAIAGRYRSAGIARKLKRAVLGAEAPITRKLFPNHTEAELLSVLATTSVPEAYDRDDLEIENRVKNLWSQHREQAEQLVDYLLGRNHNAWGEVMLSAVLAVVSASDLATLFSSRPSILISAVRRDPAIATSSSVWTGRRDLQSELFDAATTGRDIAPQLVNGIIAAMLTANSDAAVEQVFRRFGERAADSVLAWVEGNPGANLTSEWLRALGHVPLSVLRFLSVTSKRSAGAISVATRLLDPHSSEVHRAGIEIWQDAVLTTAKLAHESRIQIDAFVLAVAFDFSTSGAREAIVATFETVHAAAASRELDYRCWSFFEDNLPYLSFYRNWDKCERLRRGLIDRFDKHDWSPIDFVRCAGTNQTLVELVRTCDGYSPAGKRILKQVRRQEDAIRGSVPHEWWDTILHYL